MKLTTMVEPPLYFPIKTVFWIVTFLLIWRMHIQNNDIIELYMPSYHQQTLLT
jgi:hypothetical protein